MNEEHYEEVSVKERVADEMITEIIELAKQNARTKEHKATSMIEKIANIIQSGVQNANQID